MIWALRCRASFSLDQRKDSLISSVDSSVEKIDE